MEKYVVKFGGSSLADAKQFRKVADIIKADERRRYIVPSAPGKRLDDDIKVTDMLYACYDSGDIAAAFAPIAERFDGIITELGVDLSLADEYKTIIDKFGAKAGRDYAASRGEYLSGKVLAAYLGFNFIDAADVIFFTEEGEFDSERTAEALAAALDGMDNAVIPGFYGSMPCGTIETFSRGGSDFTGSVVAGAISATMYENWTDVSGFMAADPRIVDNPDVIDVITYRELRELSYMGATVLHEDAIFPVRAAGIPINIRNTNDTLALGTKIVRTPPKEEKDAVGTTPITGIAGRKNFSIVHIEKDDMNNEIGFVRRILSMFEEEGINFEHVPTGIDTLSIVLCNSELQKCPDIADRIRAAANPNHIIVEEGTIAMIAVVGRRMVKSRGVAARIFTALHKADINVRIIDQGSCEYNVIIGVEEDDYEKAIVAIYEAFRKK